MEPDIECGGFTFVSNFDSGNLSRVELVYKKTNGNTNTTGKVSPAEEIPDFEFNVWTKPDCAGTEYENSNRTWFYFGIKGGAPYSLVKLNIVNLNKQSKMYSQGMAPVYRMTPGHTHWERIKDKPTYNSEDNVFILSFKYRTLENLRAVTYFAFTYPFSYLEVQNMLKGIDARFKNLEDESRISPTALDDIYYHRECVCRSLEGRRIDLITISSRHLMGTEREPRLKNLFPDPSTPRPFRFLGKKVIFISARVHPGETPSSFVFNGLLNLLLSRDDTIAILLRKLYVFKLIPVLNPDGVARGHYRTDTRGVNLNRVYLNPSSILHPSVFAARSLIRYYHHGREVEDETPEILCYPTDKLHLEDDDGAVHSLDGPELSSAESSSPVQKDVLSGDSSCLQSDENKVPNVENQVALVTVEEKKQENQVPLINDDKVSPLSEKPRTLFEYPQTICQENNVFAAIRETLIRTVTGFCDINNENMANATISVKAEGLPDKALIIEGIPHRNCVSSLTNSSEVLTPNSHNKMKPAVESEFGAELENQSPSSMLLCENKDNSGSHFGDLNCESAQSEANNKISCTGISKTTIEPEESGLFLYIDLHGHASKKGIFMYGNHFENIADSVECMLLPKIMSLNNQNFHFTACNFTERNMYLRDRRDGMSREGSGRVAVLKATGLVRSYTLECNYNTGRIVNVLPPCVRDCSKPVSVYVVPPKYSPQVFEEVGRALGVSILDLTGANPWSRIPNSEFRTLSGIREWLKTNCIPEQMFAQKLLRNQKQMGMPPTNAQVGEVSDCNSIRECSVS